MGSLSVLKTVPHSVNICILHTWCVLCLMKFSAVETSLTSLIRICIND